LRYKPYVTKDQIELHIKRARVALKSESLKDTGFEFASLGRIKVVNDSIQQSIEFFNKAIEKEYEISDYHIRLARAYGSMKQAAKAKSILNEYIQWVEKNRSEYKDYLLKRVRDEITRY
jgi:tetratricopeptide (TPR) repeat protein